MAERLPGRRAAVACRFGQAFIHAGEPGSNDDGDEADAKCDVRQRDGRQSEREIEHDEEDEQ